MFGFLRQRTPAPAEAATPTSGAVGCFGKLPVHPEFIKHNAARREARALDQWLQAGVSLNARLGPREDAAAAAAGGLYRGLFAGTDDLAPTLFAVSPSHDRSGRRYPFVVFEVLGGRERALPTPMLPIHGEGFYQAAETVLRQPWRNESVDTVLAWVERVGQRPRLPGSGAGSEAATAELLRGLYPELAPAAALACLRRSVELLRQVERRTAPRVPWGLRLPLQAEEPGRSIHWWLRLAERILGRDRWCPSLVWTSGSAETPPQLLLFFRTPPAQVAAHLLLPRNIDDTLVDPADGLRVTPEADSAVLPPTTQSLLEALSARGAT